MNKKISVVLLFMIVALITVGAVCASNSDEVKINGCDFKIPEGYKVDKTADYYVVLKNADGDEIKIEAQQSVTNELNVVGDTTSIDGKEGVLRAYDNGKCSFFYMDDGHRITITAPDQSLIEAVID